MQFEFIVEGPPLSQQTRNRERLRDWKAIVRQSAQSAWPIDQHAVTDRVLLQITYFYTDIALDADNIIKPIQDAIIGVVYQDDSQITDLIVRKRNLAGPFQIQTVTPALAAGLTRGNEFLHILVTDAPNPEVLT
ncbi:MAG: RusA family crossover junction endodeoxyribonuclease [Prochlorothrix sp.]|nr:RusA family crossover junction endodeoxyribonuclease [Prochlorothrix sp.]